MMTWLTTDFLGNALMLLGAFFLLTGALGVLRFPDFFTRLHPAGIVDSVGLTLILAGTMCFLGWQWLTLKYLFLLVIALITSATACHALGQAAWRSGLRPMGHVEHRPGIGGKPRQER